MLAGTNPVSLAHILEDEWSEEKTEDRIEEGVAGHHTSKCEKSIAEVNIPTHQLIANVLPNDLVHDIVGKELRRSKEVW